MGSDLYYQSTVVVSAARNADGLRGVGDNRGQWFLLFAVSYVDPVNSALTAFLMGLSNTNNVGSRAGAVTWIGR